MNDPLIEDASGPQDDDNQKLVSSVQKSHSEMFLRKHKLDTKLFLPLSNPLIVPDLKAKQNLVRLTVSSTGISASNNKTLGMVEEDLIKHFEKLFRGRLSMALKW